MANKSFVIKILLLIVFSYLIFLYYAPKPEYADENALNVVEEDSEEISSTEPEAAQPVIEKTKDEQIQMPTRRAPTSVTENTTIQETTEGLTATSADLLNEKTINKGSIVAIQCVWDYTYPNNVYEDPRYHSEAYFQGSGIVISEAGHILTVNHVLDTMLDREPDPSGKKWFLKNCQAALTDENASPLPYNSPRFKEAEIVFQPTFEEYDYNSKNRVDFDVALLKFKGMGLSTGEKYNYPFTPLLDSLVDSGGQEIPMILSGYPGAELTGAREFTTLEFFSNLTKYSGTETKDISALFYEAGSKQYKAASESYKKFQEELFASGQDERLVKGGFSGSPVFIKGHLVGITISSSLPYVEEQDIILILSSYSISELLKKHGLLL